MAAVPVTLDGVLYDLYNRTTQRVILFADASVQGVGIGGGPIIPGQPPVGGGGPGGPNVPPHPAFPIWGGPGAGFPDKPGYPPVVGGGPIIPPEGPPTEPPQPPTENKPPPADGGWGWVAEFSQWGYFAGSGGTPAPK